MIYIFIVHWGLCIVIYNIGKGFCRHLVIKLFKVCHAGKEDLIHRMQKGRDYSAGDLKRKRLLRKKMSTVCSFPEEQSVVGK